MTHSQIILIAVSMFLLGTYGVACDEKADAHDQACETDGKVRNADTQGHCCWPG